MTLLQPKSHELRAARNHLLTVSSFVALLAIGLSFSACKKKETEPPVPPKAPPAPAKAVFEPARKTSFAEVTSQLDSGGDLYFYLATDQCLAGLSTNLARLRSLIESLPGAQDSGRGQIEQVFGTLAAIVRVSGVEKLTGVGASSVQITPELHRAKLVLQQQPGTDEGLLWTLLGRQPHPLRAMDMLPATTALAAFGDLDLNRTWTALERVLAESDFPGAGPGLRKWQQEFERGTKLSWTNLVASLGGEAGVILTLDDSRKIRIPAGSQTLELPEPGLILAMKIVNDTLYDRISQEMKSNSETVITDEPGLKMCALPLKLPLPMPLQVTVASSGDWLFAATSPALVREVLAARRDGGSVLVKSAEFKALRQHLPAEGNQFSYTSKRFSELVRDVQKRVLESQGAASEQMQALQQILFGREPAFCLAVGGRTPNGWQITQVGNQSGSGALMAGPVVGGAAVSAAMILPALAKAKARAQTISCMNNMKQVALAFKMWAVDHDDHFPFNVPADKGGTLELCLPGANGYDGNSFRHLQVMSNYLNTPKILVCPGEARRQPAANFASLLASNVTYQVRSGTNITDANPQEVLLHCPIHGHDALCDGSVRAGPRK